MSELLTMYDVPASVVLATAMERCNPLTVPLKVNTYLVEAALRNDELDCLYMWLWIRACDWAWNGQPTGRVYGLKNLVTYLASNMQRSTKTIRRHLKRADDNRYISLDPDRDKVEILSRPKLTLALWRADLSGPPGNQDSLPDVHMRHPDDVLELSIRIPELWSPEGRSKQRSLALGVVRQRATEYGWCRETVARLAGMERTSTARIDRRHNVRRGWQFGFISVRDITHHRLTKEEEDKFGRELEEKYAISRTAHHGRGQKVWLGRTPDGETAIFTQLPVKYDTQFAGRFRVDRDFQKLVERNISPSLLAGCSALRSNRVMTDARNGKPEVSTTTLSESMRDSLWRLVRELTSSMTDAPFVNPRPNIQLLDMVHWKRWTARSPNSSPSVTEKTERPRGSNSIIEA